MTQAPTWQTRFTDEATDWRSAEGVSVPGIHRGFSVPPAGISKLRPTGRIWPAASFYRLRHRCMYLWFNSPLVIMSQQTAKQS